MIFKISFQVITIQDCIEEKVPLVTPTRVYIRDGPLKKRYMKWHMTTDKTYWYVGFVCDPLPSR